MHTCTHGCNSPESIRTMDSYLRISEDVHVSRQSLVNCFISLLIRILHISLTDYQQPHVSEAHHEHSCEIARLV